LKPVNESPPAKSPDDRNRLNGLNTLFKSFFSFFILLISLWGFFTLIFIPLQSNGSNHTPHPAAIRNKWNRLSNYKKGKVIYANPPNLLLLDLTTGKTKVIPNITVAGGRGRPRRGFTPRPFWSPDGKKFIYRFQGKIFISDTEGNKKRIHHPRMKTSRETRWSWQHWNGEDWAIGPSKNGNIIQVKISDPSIVKTLYSGGDVSIWCEVTGNRQFMVFDTTDRKVFAGPVGIHSRAEAFKLSGKQICRPCAAPDNRVAALIAPHIRYNIYNPSNGKLMGALPAPEGEELYRLNWSNDPDYAVHMYGSQGNERMHIRKISTGEWIFIGYGWDPDLWME
jgi:hypothetical protein